jgi:SAM-dependent methyltransferase
VKYRGPLSPDSRVLDFGCGWGRTLRFFMRDVRRGNLYGVDCMPLAIELCRETNPWSRFALIPPLPPADLPSSHFDLVYLYSVFSHLSEDAQDQWLTEFSRVLRPGGVLIATTWPREYIERCERARHGDTGALTPARSRPSSGPRNGWPGTTTTSTATARWAEARRCRAHSMERPVSRKATCAADGGIASCSGSSSRTRIGAFRA